MNKPTNKQKDSVNTEKFIKELVEKNRDVLVAQEIMQQARKTAQPSVTIDQNNYYKLP